MPGAFIHGNLIDHFPAARFSSAHNRCAGVMRNMVVQTHMLESSDITLRSVQFLRQPVHQMQFRADGPLAAWWRSQNRANDSFRRTDFIRSLRHFKPALRVNDHANPRMFFAHANHVLRQESLMHGAVALP